MNSLKTCGVIAIAAGTILSIPRDAFAWHILMPGSICQVDTAGHSENINGVEGDWSYAEGFGGLLATGQFGNSNKVTAICPFSNMGATVTINGTNGSWYIQDNQTVTLNVSVSVSSGDDVTAQACISGPTIAQCDANTGTTTTGQQTLHPAIGNSWKLDTNGTLIPFLIVDLGHASTLNQIIAQSF